MKKFVAGLLLSVMVVSLVGCGNKGKGLDDQAAVRVYDPTDISVYIDDEYTALVGSIENAAMTEAEKQRSAELRAMAVEAFDLVNLQREAYGLPALAWNDELAVAAQVRATESVSLFSHTRPNGTDYWTVNSLLVYGENLAKGYNTAEAAVNAWMNSQSHKANILGQTENFATIGIAIFEGSDGKLYWAQEFGF